MSINALFESARQGDKQAENHLFEYLSVRFRYFAYQRIRNREEANEIVQDALMTILEEYGGLVVNTSFSAWAYKVLDNRILNYMGSQKRQFDKQNKLREKIGRSDNSSNNHGSGLKRRLLECLNKIAGKNIRYARILNLNYQGYKTDEICSRLKLTSGNLYAILSRARSLLDLCLETGRLENEPM